MSTVAAKTQASGCVNYAKQIMRATLSTLHVLRLQVERTAWYADLQNVQLDDRQRPHTHTHTHTHTQLLVITVDKWQKLASLQPSVKPTES